MKRQSGTAKTTPAATKKAAAPKKAGTQHELKPTADEVRRRAYEIYLERQSTGTPGCEMDDWMRAEQELVR